MSVDWAKQWEKSPVHELDLMHKEFRMSFPCAGGHIAQAIMSPIRKGTRRKEQRVPGSRRESLRKALGC